MCREISARRLLTRAWIRTIRGRRARSVSWDVHAPGTRLGSRRWRIRLVGRRVPRKRADGASAKAQGRRGDNGHGGARLPLRVSTY